MALMMESATPPSPTGSLNREQPVLLSLAHASAIQHVVDVGGIWNVATKATDIVKDGNRIENLAWRHWARPRRQPSQSSFLSCSSASFIQTPPDSSRTFGGTLALCLTEDGFKDWVAEAKEDHDARPTPSPPPTPPRINEPSSPVAHGHLEIRLVEPTPVPSRVGSLGASMKPTANGLLHSTSTAAQIPHALDEVEEQDSSHHSSEGLSPKKQKSTLKGKGKGKALGKGKFFVQSSPSRASVSDNSPINPAPIEQGNSADINSPSPAHVEPQASLQQHQQQLALRRSSGSSNGASKKKRHISLSTMKGKFQAEKRKAAAAIEAREAREEDGGWEDEDADLDEWGSDDEEVEKASMTASPKQIPPPAPTPLVRMTKAQREAAKAEHAEIQAKLDAQRKRAMFAKQQIFGPSGGLLSQALQRGGSMVDLQAGQTHQTPPAAATQLSSSVHPNAHSQVHHFGHSPGPSLVRSKSVVAMPLQTGVSVTVRNPMTHPETTISNQELPPPAIATTSTNNSGGRARILPPDEELETTDEESEDDYLATSKTKQKLEQLVQRKQAAKAAQAQRNSVSPGSESTAVQPIAVSSSPTADRRAMITRELSESLRKNLILERQKSSSNLTVHRPEQAITPRPNVLGRGFLRPLTRTEGASSTELPRARTSLNLHRPQSSANLTMAPGSPVQPPPMTRSNTLAGDNRDEDLRRRGSELEQRNLENDTGYRHHGW